MLRKLPVVVAVLLVPIAAHADLIVGACSGDEDSSITCDTETGLEWLDLSESVGYSINDIKAGAGGFIHDGWSIASGSQVDELFYNAGAEYFGSFGGSPLRSPEARAAVELLMQTIGHTLRSNNEDVGRLGIGLTDNQEPQCLSCIGLGLVSAPYFVEEYGGVNIVGSRYWGTNAELTYDYSSSSWGVYLYRASVPEPSTLALLGIGLAGIGFARRKKVWSKNNKAVDYRLSGARQ